MAGRLTDQFRDRLNREEDKKNTREQLADTFNVTAVKLIEEFMNEVNSNNIRIDDTADLMRLFQIYAEINNLKDITQAGTGSLPELSQRQSRHINKYVETDEVRTSEGDYEDVIDPESLMNLGEEEITQMIKEREIEMNADNADEWEDGVDG